MTRRSDLARPVAGLRRAAATAAFVVASAAGITSVPSCYSTGDGTTPPLDKFYFPVGLTVAPAGDVLWVVNSDFDLQYNGGTVQSYDLDAIRAKIFAQMAQPCTIQLPDQNAPSQPQLGQTCAPPVDSRQFVKRSVSIGAFATDIQLSKQQTRLYIPVRGNASLTWMDIGGGGDKFALDCAQQTDPNATNVNGEPIGGGRCNDTDTGDRDQQVNAHSHQAGRASDPANTRGVEMPGEPFGMAQSADGTAIVITHQNDTKASLFTTGEDAQKDNTGAVTGWTSDGVPSIEFVLDGVPVGGNGIAYVPHDLDAFDPTATPPQPPPRDAYLLTTRAAAEVDLLRYYPDEIAGDGGTGTAAASSLHRPFLQREAAYAIVGNASGVDSRGIVIDDTPRRACKAKLPAGATAEQKRACARLGARVFIANRAPASLIRGEIGSAADTAATGTYDPDHLVLFGSEPLTAGPSLLFLAPIIDRDGKYAQRLFIVCFDSATIFVWDPVAGNLENIIRVDQGPFSMAFDHFDIDKVAGNELAVHTEKADGGDVVVPDKYAFAYIASFTKSYVQVIDLDQRRPETYERVVYTLGYPTLPKGSQ